MTRALVPLSMSNISELPPRCRGCVAWELESQAARDVDLLGDGAFEKEVWLSGVMLTWGTAGQLVTVDDRFAGFALYAPPTAVPGAHAFPTSPVSPDAVLLTTARVLPQFAGQGLARYLMDGVVRELTRRGVRAIELFGLEGSAENEVDQGMPGCLLPAAFARAVGFKDIAPHHRYPRLRYELERDSGWKAEVEAALEKLFTVITVPAPRARERDLVGSGSG